MLRTCVITSYFDMCRYTFYDGPPFATGLPHYGFKVRVKVGV